MRDLFQVITNEISAQLEQGVRPWAQPWTTSRTDLSAVDLPHNIAGRAYRGANTFWLYMLGQARGYQRPVWLTFNQAREAGGHVRKGEKGAAVFFWKFNASADQETGETRRAVMVRQYTVFNIAQCEGVELPAVAPRPALFERIAAAEALAAATGADIRYGG